MKKTLVALSLSLLTAFAAQANTVYDAAPDLADRQWEVSLNYNNVNFDDADFNGGVVSAGFAYSMRNPEGHFSFVPELYLGKGVSSDTIVLDDGPARVKVDNFVMAGTRLVLHPTDVFQAYLRPSVTKMSFTGDASGTTDWELGIGVGVGMKLTDNATLTVSFDRVGGDIDSDIVSGGIRYHF